MKKQSQQQGEDIRSLFLKEFVRQVVIAGYAPLIENAKLQRKLATLQSIKKIISHPKIIERPKVVPVQVVNQIPTQLPVPRPGQPLMKQSIMNRPVNQVPNRPSIQKQMIKPQQQVQRQNQAPQAPKPRPDLQLRKITSGTGKAMIIPQKNQNDGYTESIEIEAGTYSVTEMQEEDFDLLDAECTINNISHGSVCDKPSLQVWRWVCE